MRVMWLVYNRGLAAQKTLAMTDRIQRGSLQVAAELDALVAEQILPGTGVELDAFWAGFEACLAELGPVNRELLAKRDDLQARIDAYHLERKGQALDADAYKAFLQEIGYLLPEPEDEHDQQQQSIGSQNDHEQWYPGPLWSGSELSHCHNRL